jgi:O-glycosyl hydrolase
MSNHYTFELGKLATAAKIWGGGEAIDQHVFFEQDLTLFFERTLHFSELDLQDDCFYWFFGGPHGALVITVSEGGITVEENYYDSFSTFAERDRTLPTWLQNRKQAAGDESAQQERRFPLHKTTQKETLPAPPRITSLGFESNRYVQFVLYVNGEQELTLDSLLDVHSHQLIWLGQSGSARGELVMPDVEAGVATLNTHRQYQSMIGFGGITSPVTYNLLSQAGRERWWQTIVEYNLLIQREYPIGSKLKEDLSNWDVLEDATPHYYGHNFPNGEITDFSYNRQIQALGGEVWFEFWRFPDWMVKRPPVKGGIGLQDQEPDPERYANTLVDYCKKAQARTGKPPSIVGVQNEICQSAASLREMVRSLRQKLDEAGFSQVKIHMADAPVLSIGLDFVQRFQEYPETWNTVDYTACHMYDAQYYFSDLDGLDEAIAAWNEVIGDKDFLSTELCINSPRLQAPSYRLAFFTAQLLHKNLVQLNARAICFCWLLLHTVEPNFNWTRTLFTIDTSNGHMPIPGGNQLRVFGAFSRLIAKGMRRVEIACVDPDLLLSAYSNDVGDLTIVALNRSTRPRRLTVDHVPVQLTYAEVTSPYRMNARDMRSFKQDGTTLVLGIDPGAIVTLSSRQPAQLT